MFVCDIRSCKPSVAGQSGFLKSLKSLFDQDLIMPYKLRSFDVRCSVILCVITVCILWSVYCTLYVEWYVIPSFHHLLPENMVSLCKTWHTLLIPVKFKQSTDYYYYVQVALVCFHSWGQSHWCYRARWLWWTCPLSDCGLPIRGIVFPIPTVHITSSHLASSNNALTIATVH